jgi:NAD(P)-dependent dehydrogenase (short-subunit alcohol dehydrogenase family)
MSAMNSTRPDQGLNGEESKEEAMTNVIVVIGAGSIGQAIARRVSAGKHVLLADLRQENVDAAAKVLTAAGFEVSTTRASRSTLLSRQLRRLAQ